MRTLTIEINKHDYSSYAEECQCPEEFKAECDDTCRYLDGDRRELDDNSEQPYDLDGDDIECAEGDVIQAAVDHIIRTAPGNYDASLSPIEDVREYCWLTDTYEHPEGYERETTVRFTGDWTVDERTEIFRRIAVHS